MVTAKVDGPSGPPEFLKLAAHPVRWQLLSELSRSDRRVGELSSRLQSSQNLVSYHLGRLRAAHVVSARRSSADRRDTYYSLDLRCCAQMLAAAASALHPGLGQPSSAPPTPEGTPARVLFLCTGNSARSQMAEALLSGRTNNAVEAYSAGSHPTRLHPNAIKVMRAYGFDLTAGRCKHVNEFAGDRFDYVVTLCDRVREICPEFPAPARAVHWSIPNPVEPGESDEASYPAFERTAAELAERIASLVELLRHERDQRG